MVRALAVAVAVAGVPALVGSWAILGLETVGDVEALGLLVLAALGTGLAVMGASTSRRGTARAMVLAAGGGVCVAGWYAAYATV